MSDENESVEARLLRTRDLIDLRLEAPGCVLKLTDGGAELVAQEDACLVVHFPPQHLGEEVWQVHPTPAPPPPPAPQPPKPTHPSQHRASGPTRLVYDLPAGTRIPWALESVLAALPGLKLRVSPLATAAGVSVKGSPEPPGDRQTAIEAPYRLIVSPSDLGAFRHSSTPVGPQNRAELWRTHLNVHTDDGFDDEHTTGQRIVRALWTRDNDLPDPGFDQPLLPFDRQAIVDQTHGGNPGNATTPLLVDNLSLSSLGAWFDWKQSWPFPASIVDYRHQSFMGRDGYVRVAYPGFLFPFGHRCFLVKITEREIKHRDTPVAYLWQRWFIVLQQPTRKFLPPDRDNPFTQLTISPLVTPDIDEPPGRNGPVEDTQPFVPRRGGVPFPFTLTTLDRGGEVRSWAAPLVFVQAGMDFNVPLVFHPEQASPTYSVVRRIVGRGQSLAMAEPVRPGDTSVEVTHLIFDGDIDEPGVTARPFLTELRAVVPAMRHLAPQAPAVDLEYAKPYLKDGLPSRGLNGDTEADPANPGELVLAFKGDPAAIDFSNGSERSGGFISPNIAVRGVSRSLGAIGEDGHASSVFDHGTFDPGTFLAGAFPKLFGLFDLLELLKTSQILDEAPAFVSDAMAGILTLLTEARRLRAALDEAQARLATEVTKAAHDGARAIAQQAKDALDARIGPLRTKLDALINALRHLATDQETVSTTAAALGTELRPLLDALQVPGFPAAVRSALEKSVQVLQTLTDLAKDAAGLAQLLQGAAGQVTARLQWRPAIKSWGSGSAVNIFQPNDEHALQVDVEVRASTSAPPTVDVLAEIVDFDLNLIGDGNTGLMKLMFRRIGFHTGSVGKPEVDVVFGGIAFLGPLGFVDRLRELIPFDGFSDPPYVDVAPSGVTAGFDIALPNVSVGVFSLENIALGADARIPFLGDAMTVGFHFCAKDAPFRLTVMCIGGGGWLVLRASPKGLVLLELGLEAAASLSVDLGVASGSVSVSVGVYLRLEGDNGLLTAYFRIRGQVEVLGLISASITLELSLTYQFKTGKLVGRASVVVEVEVLFFSASVRIAVERQLAGSKGDPTMYQVMPPGGDGMNADWLLYCDAFAPIPA